MRILIQRVREASVTIDAQLYSSIGAGLLVLVGIEDADSKEDVAWLCGKLLKLRIFNDDAGVMNRSAEEIGADILIVSQFTLHASPAKAIDPPTSVPPAPKRPYRFMKRLLRRSVREQPGKSKRDVSEPTCRWH